MRDKLKKLVDGGEALLQILGTVLFYILMSPFFVIVWSISIVRILYNYSKHPDVTFEECVRYNFTFAQDKFGGYKADPKGFIDLFYIPRREFDLEEYKRVEQILEGSN